MLQQKNESVKFKNFIKEVRNDNKRHNYCYERYSPVALPLPICHRIMKKPAYKHEVFRQDAVLAPQEPYSEKFRKGTTDIETECLKRRAPLCRGAGRGGCVCGCIRSHCNTGIFRHRQTHDLHISVPFPIVPFLS